METIEILTAARALLEKPEAWCQGQSAKDAKGKRVRWESDAACSWCVLGAVSRALGHKWTPMDYSAAVTALGAQTRPFSPQGWNDRSERTHADVLALFDKAIAAASETVGVMERR